MAETENSYPEAFTRQMQARLGEDYHRFVSSLSDTPPVSVRLHPFKPGKIFAGATPVSWCENGRYLPSRPSFTFDPLFHAGAYYVQEASSMFIEQVWRQLQLPHLPVRVLDLCAAPGGKSTHLLSLMPAQGLLVSNEVISNRNHILQENITKWGMANVVVTQNKASDFSALPDFFDVVLVDAPCSGEGLFRKDKHAISEWSEANVQHCCIRQKEIIPHAINCLKPGGYLLYSTCTYEPAENDEVVQFACQLGMEKVPLELTITGLQATEHGVQFWPHRIAGEGFFISLLRKSGESDSETGLPRHLTSPARYAAYAQAYLAQPDSFILTEKNDTLYAIPGTVYSDFQRIAASFYIRHAGIPLGTIKGADFIPAAELALSIHLRKDLPAVELSEQEAIAYLRCEAIRPATGYRGWIIAKYCGLPLGWLKVMEQRSNNYFPKAWRIRKSSNFTSQ